MSGRPTPRGATDERIQCPYHALGTSGPTIVLIHGSAQGGSAGGDRHFVAQRSLGERGYQIIVPDRPGHGLSPSPGRPDDAEADSV